jgi:peptidoglycan hydrolase-like protein with peptidoglycan-binding domain
LRKVTVVSETIEDLKAIAAALADRARHLPRARWVRRLRRRPSRFALTVLGGGVIVFVAANAGWLQPASHPAPLFAGEAGALPPQLTRIRDMAPREVALADPKEGEALARLAGEPSPLVASIQERLAALGYYGGPADGLQGPATTEAIHAFEAATGLPATGKPGLELLASLAAASGAAPAARPAPAATAGRTQTAHAETSAGAPTAAAAAASAAGPPAAAATIGPAEVKFVQSTLANLGYGTITVDGIFGAETAGAIRRFQAANGLPQTGRITPELLRTLSGDRATDI